MNRHSAPRPAETDAIGLPALEARLRQDLAWLELPKPRWVPERWHDAHEVLPVAIVGGGMAGMTVAASLLHLGVPSPMLDRAPDGFEGPWATTARMETLRSPKQLTGPSLGLPALTFRAWFEAQFGTRAWEALGHIPRLQWMDYLRWYRGALGLDVRNRHEVRRVRPRADGLVRLDVVSPAGEFELYARHVVLATGRDGLGGPSVPPWALELPRRYWAHSSDEMDYATLAGRRVGVIGGGSSAMDVAATALEAGAARVELLVRRADLPRVNKGKGAGNPGFVHGYAGLPDDWKWRIRRYINVQQVPPPHGSTLRVSRHPNAYFNLGCAVRSVDVDGESLAVHTTRGTCSLDFLLFATGFRIDWASRPELAAIAPHVRTWGDRYSPPPDDADDRELLDSPDLGPAFEFQARDPAACPGLERIHCFCYPATMSHGTVSGDIPAITEGAQRLARGLVRRLYAEDIDVHYERLLAYDDPELVGDEWEPAPPPTQRSDP